MNADTKPFDDVDFNTWRARVEQGSQTLDGLAHAGLEGIELAALYDRGPTQPVVVPPRTGGTWTCLQSLPGDRARAIACAQRLPDAKVAGVWLAGADVGAIVAAIPAQLQVFVDGVEPAPDSSIPRHGDGRGRVVAWAVDPCAPWGPAASIDAALRIEAAIARAARRPVRTWLCDGTPWHDAGATAVDEIAIVLLGVLGALRSLGDRGVSAPEAASSLLMRVGLGGELLVDVAKLRALRGLWHACAGPLGLATGSIPLHARTCRRLRSRSDADTNLVRASYELFAGAAAGVDALIVEPHDHRGTSSDGLHRWARNLTHLMRDESHLDAVEDPFAGSWAVESITRALADAAWARVQEIEHAGGLSVVVAEGGLQGEVVGAARRRRQAVASGTHPIVGVSKFPPPGRASPPEPTVSDSPQFGPLDLCAPYEPLHAGGAS